MLNCLEQVELFTAFDYNSHILLVAKTTTKVARTPTTPEIALFLSNASLLQDVNEEIFDFLSSV
jgi:hypothetical protein